MPRVPSRNDRPHTVATSCCAFGTRQSGWLFGSRNLNDARCVAPSESREGVRISTSYNPGNMPGSEKRPRSSVCAPSCVPVSYTHLRAHETPEHLVCRLLLEKKK